MRDFRIEIEYNTLRICRNVELLKMAEHLLEQVRPDHKDESSMEVILNWIDRAIIYYKDEVKVKK